MRKTLLLLTIIALVMRFYRIAEVPWSLNWDEAAFGYNAYSLLLTGKDEYGKVMPLQFLSIGDYKCPLYIYLLVPAIKLLGLNEWAVRSVPALLGVMTVPLLFIITRQLLKNNRIGNLAALSLAISPWHLQFTRAGADVAVSSFFLILGVALALRNKFALAGISFGLTFYSYFGERAYTPLMLILLVLYMGKLKKELLISFSITVLPLVITLVSAGHINKITNTSILGYVPAKEYSENLRKEDHIDTIFRVFHNKAIDTFNMIGSRYLNHYSPIFLFVNGPEDGRQRIDGMGMLYRSDIVLLTAFLVWILKTKPKNRSFLLIAGWLLTAPIPAAITRDPVHARRSFNLIYPICIFLGIGANYLWINRKRYWPAIAFYGGTAIWSICFYLTSYYILTPRSSFFGSAGWQYGYKQLVKEISPMKNSYSRVVVDTTYQGPYIFFLFYEKYPPQSYQPQAQLIRPKETELGEGAGFENYVFKDIYWPEERNIKNTLYAGPPERLPLKDIDIKQSRVVKTINFPDGSEAWRIVETVKE